MRSDPPLRQPDARNVTEHRERLQGESHITGRSSCCTCVNRDVDRGPSVGRDAQVRGEPPPHLESPTRFARCPYRCIVIHPQFIQVDIRQFC